MACMTTRKTTVLLNIVSDDKLLLQTKTHPVEGYAVLDSFGYRIDSIEQADACVHELAEGILRGAYDLALAGRMVDYIQKPQGDVRLETIVYKVEISHAQVSMAPTYAWYSQGQLELDPRFKRDRHLLPYYFSDKVFSIEFAECQMGRWDEATLLWLKEIK